MAARARSTALLGLVAVPLTLVATLLPGTGTASEPHRSATRSAIPSLLTAAPTLKGKAPAAPKNAGRHRLVGLRTSLLPRHAAGQQLRFNLFGTTSFIGTFESKQHGPGFTVWSGRLDAPYGDFEIARSGSRYSISLTSLKGSYLVSKAAGRAYWVTQPRSLTTQRDDSISPPSTGNRSRPSIARSGPAPIVGGDSSTVDVLFVYTAAAAAELGGVSGINTYVGNIQAQTNQAYANSGIPLTMRAVGIVPTGTVEAGGDLTTDLERVQTPGDGYYDEVPGERDAYHADLVHLLIHGDPLATNRCGLAYIGMLTQDTTAYAYGTSYVSQKYCAINHTVTHETAHNLGADHDEYVNPGTQVGEAPYAHGFVNVSTGSISVMSYPNQVQAQNNTVCCKYPLLFSDPRTTYEGVVEGDPATQDNARAITEYAQRAVDYRQSQIYTGTVTMTGTPRVGKTLGAAVQGWLPGGLGYTYQWTLDGRPIAGATGQTLALRAAYVGHQVGVIAAGSGADYTPMATSSAPTTIFKGLFRHTTRPVLLGQRRVGHTLTVAVRHYRPKPQSIKVVWFRGGHRLSHHGTTYRLHRKDAGHQIWAKVTIRRGGYVSVHKKTAKALIRR